MIRIINTFDKLKSISRNQTFDLGAWESYVNSIHENCAHIFKNDVQACIATGKYTFQNDFLPIINAVHNHPKFPALLDSISINRNTINYFTHSGDNKYDTTNENIMLGEYRARLIEFITKNLGLEKKYKMSRPHYKHCIELSSVQANTKS